MFNFSADLPSISSIDEKPDLRVEPTVKEKKIERPPLNVLPEVKLADTTISEHNYNDQVKPMEADSATESDADEPDKLPSPTPVATTPVAKVKVEASSGSESSSPHRPAKRPKPKMSSSSDEDSEPRNVAGTSSGGTRRGAAPRQPIKRGGKRF
jgi:hypothetical protein